MKTQRIFTALFLAIVLVLINVSTVFAVPPTPSSFYGTVKVDGMNVAFGTVVSAYINGIQYASTTVTTTYLGDTVYSFNVPGDDTDITSPDIDGGRSGDTIVFYVGGVISDQTAPWVSGSNVQLNLTVTNTPIPPTATYTPTRTPTNTPVPPTATYTSTRTPTNTPISPTATYTSTRTPTNTPVLPTATHTSTRTPTNTPIPPTATHTSTRTPTNTSIPPTATHTSTRTPTNTPVPPTATYTSTRTPTNTPVPPTATYTSTRTPTNTPVLPTATHTSTRTPTNTPSNTNLPPYTKIINYPPNPSNNSAAIFLFIGKDDVTSPSSLTFECKLDGSAWASCLSPMRYKDLAQGSHTFSARAKDAEGNVDPTPPSCTWTIITNRPPVADAGGPYFGKEGTSISLSASRSADPDYNIVLYEWDLDTDGLFDDATGVKSAFKAIDNGIFTIRVRVTDAGGLSSIDNAIVTVKNVAPVIKSLSVNSLIRVGSWVNARATFMDVGINDTFTAVWKWGDNATSTGAINGGIVSGSHIYTKPGIYLVTITITDEDGGVGQAIKLIIVLPKK